MNPTNRLTATRISKCVRIPANDVHLLADLEMPMDAQALVILAYDFGRTRNHPRPRRVARVLRDHGFGTLLCDLLTEEEEIDDEASDKYHEDAELLAGRLQAVTEWATENPDTKGMRIAYFGARTGGGATLIAAAKMKKKVAAVVSRGGRLDLAGKLVSRVVCPTLLIVGENDGRGVEINRKAFQQLKCGRELMIVPGASELFGEPEKLDAMAKFSAEWLRRRVIDPYAHS